MKAFFNEPEIQVEQFCVETVMAGNSFNYGENDTPITPFGDTPAIQDP